MLSLIWDALVNQKSEVRLFSLNERGGSCEQNRMKTLFRTNEVLRM